jgi:8-oxo-dGTP pyrophosphatase MutT (NUDIX family)
MKKLIENWRRFTVSEGKDVDWSSKCIIFDDAGRIMMVEVANRGTYDLPGGHGQGSESPLQAVKREVFEEVGLKIDQIIKIGPMSGKINRFLFAAMNFSGTFDLQLEEVSDYVWIAVEDLIIQTHQHPERFEESIISAIKIYKKKIRNLRDDADKVEYFQSHSENDPEDYMVRPASNFGWEDA